MTYPFTNNKRIRGWPKMVRKLDQLMQRSITPDLNVLNTYGYDAYKFLIAPFSNLDQRNPPAWYFRLYIDSMLQVSKSWKLKLDEIGSRYYLALWLFTPDWSRSQVVVAVNERIGHYDSFFKERPHRPAFPNEFADYESAGPWSCHYNYEYYLRYCDELSAQEIQRLLDKGAKSIILKDDEQYLLDRGNIWVLRFDNDSVA